VVFGSILMALEPSRHLKDRFTHVRQCLVEMFPKDRRPGRSYQGFVAARSRISAERRGRLKDHLRICHRRVAGPFVRRLGWEALAVDGSRIEVPRTGANEAAFGCAGRHKTGPQLSVTTLYHMGSGLPWDWRIGRGPEPERDHLLSMLDSIPAAALLVADIGFTGYKLFQRLIEQDVSFLIRVGRNVSLLTDLGLEMEREGNLVWLWPLGHRDQAPIQLRLIRVTRSVRGSQRCKRSKRGKRRRSPPPKGDVYLVTNVFDETRLSDDTAAALYRMWWGVEVFYRSFKRTLDQHKMRSAAPLQAREELQWALIGYLLLGLMSVQALVQKGRDPLALSVAEALRTVRDAMRTSRLWRRRGDLRVLLSKAVKDSYLRPRPKSARDWPHKKHDPPPAAPQIRKATSAEIHAAKRTYHAA